MYNANGSGADMATLALTETYTQDGLRISMTLFENDAESAGTAHNRMKIYFLNGSNQRAHQIFALQREGELLLTDSSNTMLSQDLKRSGAGEPLRIEMEFDFTNQMIRYRTALLVQDAWSWSAWSAEKGTNPADSGSALDGLAAIRFSNEYLACNITVDDLRVSVPIQIESSEPVISGDEISINQIQVEGAPQGSMLLAAGYDQARNVTTIALVEDGACGERAAVVRGRPGRGGNDAARGRLLRSAKRERVRRRIHPDGAEREPGGCDLGELVVSLRRRNRSVQHRRGVPGVLQRGVDPEAVHQRGTGEYLVRQDHIWRFGVGQLAGV